MFFADILDVGLKRRMSRMNPRACFFQNMHEWLTWHYLKLLYISFYYMKYYFLFNSASC